VRSRIKILVSYLIFHRYYLCYLTHCNKSRNFQLIYLNLFIFRWTPSTYNTQLLSSSILYLVSGFIPLQLEFQNFLASHGFGGPLLPTAFRTADSGQSNFSALLEDATQSTPVAFSEHMRALQVISRLSNT